MSREKERTNERKSERKSTREPPETSRRDREGERDRKAFSDSKINRRSKERKVEDISPTQNNKGKRTFPVRSSPRATSRPRSCSATRSRCRTFLAASLYFSSWTRRRASSKFRKRGGRETNRSRDTSSSSQHEGAFLEILNENETTTFPLLSSSSSFLLKSVPRWCLLLLVDPKKALSSSDVWFRAQARSRFAQSV